MGFLKARFAAGCIFLTVLYLCIMLVAKKQMDTFLFHEDAKSAVEARSMDSENRSAHSLPIDDDFLEDFDLNKYKGQVVRRGYAADLPVFQPNGVAFGDDLNRIAKQNKGNLNVKNSRLLEILSKEMLEEEKNGVVVDLEALERREQAQIAEKRRKELEKKKEEQKWLPKKKKKVQVSSAKPKVLHVNRNSLVEEVDKMQIYEEVKFPEFIEEDESYIPGYGGRPHKANNKGLSEEEEEQKERDFEVNFFDESVSRAISVHRHLPDGRSIKCQRNEYSRLPPVSILIVFHNEAWTTLLRTLHSILDRTPSELLGEIVLLDDYSDQAHLKRPLEAYVQRMPKVRLLRARKRLGLIMGRNELFQQSRGDIVVFLDSHIECFPGWLEPLIKPIANNSRAVVFPNIEYINPATFQVASSKYPSAVGGFDISRMNFNWLYDRNDVNKKSGKDYLESPTMPGGLYAISREWFSYLGGYDEKMNIWGAENLEISFKIWMCGGQILLSACSHVGHVFRRQNPNLVGQRLGWRNMIRLAEVWMDGYKHLFYEELAYELGDFGDVAERVQIRNSLQCHSFHWYLTNILPEVKKKIDEYGTYSGFIQQASLGLCIDRMQMRSVKLLRCNL
ncbi:polypeptide N-acetylgalactosaminyltransferase 5, partial [Aplysia californica]|uniref:Polypeptide N-acetylgalactosaminyltransferase 5 n=1 Tax=Aplysia californica TaxID=6500 RepID=A0ABM0JUV3_APLCA